MPAYSTIIALTTVLACVAACGNDTENENDTTAVRGADGVYDATVDLGEGAFESTAIVFAREPDGVSIRVELGNDASVSFGGPVGADGSIAGSATFLVTDIVFQGTGEAVFSANAGVDVVTGSATAIDTPFARFDHVTFTMQRPRDADARGFSGTYRFTLTPSPSECACTSTLDLATTFDASGIATSLSTATERADDGTTLASLEGVSGSISPEGRLRVTASYQPEADPFSTGIFVELIGVVDASGAVTTANGETFSGFTPANRVGTWTAARLEGGP